MSDARKQAEEAIRRWDLCDPSRFHELRDELEGVYACADDMAHALRALLAEQGAGGGRATKAVELLSSAKHHLRSDSPMRAAIEAFLAEAPLAPPPAPSPAPPKAEQDGAGARLPATVRSARDKARAAIDREGGPMTPWGLDMCAVLDALDDWERVAPAPSPASDEVTQRNRARAEHILNHYDRRSKEDTFALARRLDADDAALSRGSKPASDEVLEAAEIAESAPELNLNNYDHEQVRELNDAMVAVTLKLRAALASERAARVAAERERDEARAGWQRSVRTSERAESSLSRAVEALREARPYVDAAPYEGALVVALRIDAVLAEVGK